MYRTTLLVIFLSIVYLTFALPGGGGGHRHTRSKLSSSSSGSHEHRRRVYLLNWNSNEFVENDERSGGAGAGYGHKEAYGRRQGYEGDDRRRGDQYGRHDNQRGYGRADEWRGDNYGGEDRGRRNDYEQRDGYNKNQGQSRRALFYEIQSREAEFMRLFNAGNAAGVADLYVANAHLLPPNAAVVKGHAGIEAFFSTASANGTSTLALVTKEVNGSGEWAWERGSYKLNNGTGAYLIVWKKVYNRWMIQNDCFTVDTPATCTA